jgi:hypothetical protein
MKKRIMAERRLERRFRVNWPIKVLAHNANGSGLEEIGVLRDISTMGAYGFFRGRFEVGTPVTVTIRSPIRLSQGWISYPGRAIRLESLDEGLGIAFIFEAIRPSFVSGP